MFDQTFVDTHARTRKPWTFSASIAIQTGIVAVALIVPLMHPGILRPKFEPPLVFAVHHTEPPPINVIREAPRHTAPHGFFAPAKVPATIAKDVPMIADAPEDIPFLGAMPPSGPTGIVPGLNTKALPDEPPIAKPRVEPAKPAPPARPITVSTGVQSAKLTFGPKPAYPALAKASRTQGIVRIEAVIATNGVIKDLKVISGPPLLQRAAIDAVSQWRYQPTFLNGVAVEVLTEIDVNFTLN